MKKILSYPLSVLYYVIFGLSLVVFQLIQWFMLNVFGYSAHKMSADVLNWFLLRSLNILGTTFTFENPYDIKLDQPCIIVANHQGQYDIPPIIWYLRYLHPKFIAKKELGKGIPSISYNLRHGGSVLIDREDREQAVAAIQKIAAYCNTHNRSVVIFPEGTRSRDGIPKRFARAGLVTLLQEMPNALIVPLTINNSWKLMRGKAFPMDLGVHVKHQVREPFFVKDHTVDTLITKVEQVILQDFKTIRERKIR